MVSIQPVYTMLSMQIKEDNSSWCFEGISESFEHHIRRSVPFYDQGHELACMYSDFFVSHDSIVYEIGTSSGVLAEKFLAWHTQRSQLRYVGIDPVPDMIDHARKHIVDPRAAFVCEDILNVELEPSNLIVSYYTMQFIHPSVRQMVFDKIFDALNWGGALILFEKVRAPDARFQDYSNQIYNDFKIGQGFSEAEIIGKSRSLKGVLEPFSEQANIDMMKRAGFQDISTIFKWVCFEGFLAIK